VGGSSGQVSGLRNPEVKSATMATTLKKPKANAKRDRSLVRGSLAHYEDPGYYQKCYQDRLDDVVFYSHLAKELGGPVLEYGIGSGRIALAIARSGIKVVGIDHSSAMLKALEESLIQEPELKRKLSFVEGDMMQVELAQRFPTIFCTFNTFLHLYTREDIENFLEKVRYHLRPGGRFVVDIALPQMADLAREPTRGYHLPRFRHHTKNKVVKYTEYFDYDAVSQVLYVSSQFTPTDGSPGWEVPLAHRQFFPQELEALLVYNGFQIEEVFGGFERGPLHRHSDVGVWVTTLSPTKAKTIPKTSAPKRTRTATSKQ
jgi:ubiquinone/menaquinone biosynthesis C-methylase UbiE